MKASKFVLAASLALSLLGSTAPVFAEEPQPEEPQQSDIILEETEQPSEEITEVIPEEEPAEEIAEETAEEQPAEETPAETTEDDEIVVKLDDFVNPLYENVLTVEEMLALPDSEPEEGENAELLNASRTCSSLNEAAVWLRGQMKSRVSYVEITIPLNYATYGSNIKTAVNTVYEQLLDGAMAHTKTGTEGDYIYWHWGGLSSPYGTYRPSSGTMLIQTGIKYYTTSSQETKTSTAVTNLLKELNIGSDWSDYDKIHKIYEWITKNVKYTNASDYSTNMYYHTAYSAIVDKSTVCQGYASLLYRLALAVGVDCRVVAGLAEAGNDDSAHGWNIVKIDGKWYNLDSTWDAGYSASNWRYFLKAAYPFSTEHNNWEKYTTSAWKSKYGVSSSDYSTAKLNKVKEFVKRLYTYCLGRSADTNGLLNWAGSLQNKKKSAAVVVQGFFGGQEYKNRNRSDRNFISDCYRVMMNRNYDTGGMNNWLNYLQKDFVSRTYVLRSFVASEEFNNVCNSYGVTRGSIGVSEGRDLNIGITRFVVRLYQNVLNRNPDIGGLNGWCKMINGASQKKSTAIQVAVDGFFHSKEFKNSNTSNSAYVNILYKTFLNRAADTGGYNNWMNKLRSGTSRDDVLKGFANSQEFANLMASYGIK